MSRSVPFASVLFVCYGNVCRSPFAAALFARMARETLDHSVRVTSAGFIGPDRQPPSPALAAALRRGLDMNEHRSALITVPDIETSDLVVVMSAQQHDNVIRQFGARRDRVLILGDLDPEPIIRRTVIDPWGSEDAVFDESYDRIER